MRFISIFILLLLLSAAGYSQNCPRGQNGKGFPSVFHQLDKGEFSGTLNGMIRLNDASGEEIILEFEKAEATLSISATPNSAHDLSTKTYRAGNNGKTEIEYRTHGKANGLTIFVDGTSYEFSFIDGNCSKIFEGISYSYKSEGQTEHMVMMVTEEFYLSNGPCTKTSPKIRVLPPSTLAFSISKK